MSHERPWRKQYAKTFSGNGSFPLYLVDATGRKIGIIWGREDGEKEETADLIIRAVRAYDNYRRRLGLAESDTTENPPATD